MWQAPNPKTPSRGAKKSGRERSRQSLHIVRVTAELRTTSETGADGKPAVEATARIMLNDLSGKGVGVFSDKSFRTGQEIALTLAVPDQIFLRGVVIYCQEHELHSHVISDVRYGYRIGIKFVFESPAEEAAAQKCCEDLVKTHLNPAA